MSERTAGGVRLWRFLIVTAPATVACLTVVAGIFLGWFPVSISAARPIAVGVTHGTADSLQMGAATDQSITGLETTREGRGVALVDIADGRLDDLCLLPRVYLPLLGRTASLRITSPDDVLLSQVTLAARDMKASQLQTPEVSIGFVPGSGLLDKGFTGGPGSFSLASSGDDQIVMDDLAVAAYGMVLPDGMRLSSLGLRPSFDDQSC